MPRRLAFILGAFVLLAVALAAGPTPRAAIAADLDAPGDAPGGTIDAQAQAPICTIARRYVRAINGQPAVGVTAFVPPGGTSTSIDEQGRIRLGVSRYPAVFRVIFPEDVFDTTEGGFTFRDGFSIPGIPFSAGTYDMYFRVYQGCYSELIAVREVRIQQVPESRPAAPPVPAGYIPSQATRDAQIPGAAPFGNAINVPWDGLYWLTAPVVTVGVCISDSVAAAGAAAFAIEQWKAAPSFPWQIVRNDTACSDDFTEPKLLFKHATLIRSPFVGGGTYAVDADGKQCFSNEVRVSTCWVKTATVVLNAPGFDRAPSEEQTFIALHKMGHALGLDHAFACGDTVMYYTDLCRAAPTMRAGADDIASLTELLGATLRVLQSQAP